ncbi:MAG: class I SAM-dependent methyltransferase [Pseudonocardiaceae bacterium]
MCSHGHSFTNPEGRARELADRVRTQGSDVRGSTGCSRPARPRWPWGAARPISGVLRVENAATDTFDLVIAAQSWHWVDPDRGAHVAARALRPGGALCVWWNRPRDLAGPVWDAIHDAYAEHAPSLDRRTALQQPEQRLEPAAGFTPWAAHTYDWSAHYDAESYTGLIQTHSDHLQLPTTQREHLINAIRTAITDTGAGQLEYCYRTLLLTAHAR